MSKHTPGPWTVYKPAPPTLHDFEIVDPSGNYIIARVTCYGSSSANSQLMAAAPEMLELLEEACAESETHLRDRITELLTRINPTT